MVFGSSAAVKKALRGSGIYNNFVDTLTSQSKDIGVSQSDTTSSGLLVQPQVKQAAKTAFSPAILQSSSEQIIDSMYGWLRGNSAKPDFRIDLSQPKQRFAELAADNAAARAQQLPACSLQQLRELANSTPDPFNVPCLPSGYNISTIRNKVVEDLATNQEFLKDPVITADSLPKDSQGKSVFDQASGMPKIFHWLLLAPWIIGGFTVLTGGGLVLLYDEKRRGLHTIGVSLLGSGVFLLISTLVLSYAFKQVSQPSGQFGKLVANDFQHTLLGVLQVLSSAFNRKLYLFGAAYIASGAAILIILRFTRPKIEKPKPQTTIDSKGMPLSETTKLPHPAEHTTEQKN